MSGKYAALQPVITKDIVLEETLRIELLRNVIVIALCKLCINSIQINCQSGLRR